MQLCQPVTFATLFTGAAQRSFTTLFDRALTAVEGDEAIQNTEFDAACVALH